MAPTVPQRAICLEALASSHRATRTAAPSSATTRLHADSAASTAGLARTALARSLPSSAVTMR